MKKLFFAMSFAFIGTANASSFLSISYANSIPLGPFTPDQTIQFLATATNTSIDQSISICEGVCTLDGNNAYSLGALFSGPSGPGTNPSISYYAPTSYKFIWGNGGDSSLGFLDGQLNGTLLPGQQKDFVFGELIPFAPNVTGSYGFGMQMQIFAANSSRPMIDSSSFSGTFQVVDAAPVPEPENYAMLLAGLGFFGFMAKRWKMIAV